MRIFKKVLLPLMLVAVIIGTSFGAGTATAMASTSSPTEKVIETVKPKYTTYVYNRAERKPAVYVYDADGNRVASKYFTVAYKNNINAGTATVTVTGKAPYTGTASAKFTITKAVASAFLNNTATVSKSGYKKTATVKASAVKTTKKKVGQIKLYLSQSSTTYVSAGNKVKFSATSNYSKVKVTSTGAIYVLKGAKKGTYKITVKVAATQRNYKSGTRTIVVKVV